MNEWGLDDAPLRDVNPALVYTSITGFGPDGPYADLKAYEGVVAAKVGLYSRGIFGFSVTGRCSRATSSRAPVRRIWR